MENRIIGDFIEINADIVQQQFDSKLPNFLSKMRAKYQRKKLLKRVERIRKSGLVLNTDQIIEFFTYICNKFYPDSTFGHVKKCVVREDISEAVIETETQMTAIVMDQSKYPKFNVISKIFKSDDSSVGITIDTDKLSSENIKKDKFLDPVNTILVNDICDFIKYSIEPYTISDEEKIEENDNGSNKELIQVDVIDAKYNHNWDRIRQDGEESTDQTDNS